MSEVRLAAEPRTEFGKGAARRTRRAGKIPAVLYGHGSDPKHLALPALEFARVIREHGTNAVLKLDLGNGGSELALTKTVTTHPIKNYIEHVDLLLVQRGETVKVAVPVVVTGEAAPGTLVTHELAEVELEAEALHIPEQVEVSIDGAEAGTQIHVSELPLPEGIKLFTDADALVVNVVPAPTASDMEAAEAPAEAEAPEEEAAEEQPATAEA
ncbi:50S ribosomal protein L25 [Longimycelium tulufanense]|uniref:Large ribosomal subunit protein bL25 n=1 Tax=Longimycelium tulufanense TaxID=907463 RepID=A0A8J3CCL9_9PSEU|nr:50S ribosomal protein L25/general stress protein Ctc [Longimycelium tulufanense]GGM74493.1 50S ribosomal protein L25 [Longimycelium tulufanense]